MFLFLLQNVICSLSNAGHGIILKTGVMEVRTVKILSHGEINYLWSWHIILTIA